MSIHLVRTFHVSHYPGEQHVHVEYVISKIHDMKPHRYNLYTLFIYIPVVFCPIQHTCTVEASLSVIFKYRIAGNIGDL